MSGPFTALDPILDAPVETKFRLGDLVYDHWAGRRGILIEYPPWAALNGPGYNQWVLLCGNGQQWDAYERHLELESR